jgi:putative aminopeptidase FrvX
MILDVGATSKEDAIERFHMGMGEPVVPATSFCYDDQTGIAFGKAFDCRAGVTAELLALRELSRRDDLPFDVVASVSSMEEVGERGVAAAIRHFKPQVAFMFEGCPADDTFHAPDDIQTALRHGPMFRYFDCCMITNPRYQRFVLKCASEAGLACQTSVREGGGTDGGPAHMMDVPSVVAGVPCRYVHAGTAICALDDVEETARVAVEVVSHLTVEVARGF